MDMTILQQIKASCRFVTESSSSIFLYFMRSIRIHILRVLTSSSQDTEHIDYMELLAAFSWGLA